LQAKDREGWTYARLMISQNGGPSDPKTKLKKATDVGDA